MPKVNYVKSSFTNILILFYREKVNDILLSNHSRYKKIASTILTVQSYPKMCLLYSSEKNYLKQGNVQHQIKDELIMHIFSVCMYVLSPELKWRFDT